MCTIDWNAFGTWVLVLVTGFTFWKLIEYARDTRRIADRADDQLTELQNQGAAARRPYIEAPPQHRTGQYQDPDIITFANRGSGPLLNLTVSPAAGPEPPLHNNGSVGTDATFLAAFDKDAFVTYQNLKGAGVKFRYTDTAGKKYWTTVRVSSQTLTREPMFYVDTGEDN